MDSSHVVIQVNLLEDRHAGNGNQLCGRDSTVGSIGGSDIDAT